MSTTPFRHFFTRVLFQRRIRVDGRSIKAFGVPGRSQTASAEVNQEMAEWLMTTLSRGCLTPPDLV